MAVNQLPVHVPVLPTACDWRPVVDLGHVFIPQIQSTPGTFPTLRVQ